ncbi:hypothetical protein PIB30_027703 [Stylosanthes scabra]|uniref:Retrotransposon gag domain-containing protein n=1 Tax=Stylosanthes scabra TaxID=79078 RepID=A0ABU6VDS8_9FABA|nr:hypothetical protein [Stylosanthes scabra]
MAQEMRHWIRGVERWLDRGLANRRRRSRSRSTVGILAALALGGNNRGNVQGPDLEDIEPPLLPEGGTGLLRFLMVVRNKKLWVGRILLPTFYVMNCECLGDAMCCKAFPISLAGQAMRWFNSLPTGSIYSFSDIRKQLVGETIRDYMDRYNKIVLEVNVWNQAVVALGFAAGLLEGDFRKHLIFTEVKTMEEIQKIALEYMWQEDTKIIPRSQSPSLSEERYLDTPFPIT